MHLPELETALATLDDNADELSAELRTQLKQLCVELAVTDLDDEIIIEFAQQAESVRKTIMYLWPQLPVQ